MSKIQIHIGVNITPNELTEQLFMDDKLPKNYEVRSYDKKGFQTMLKMSKPTIMSICDSSGVCNFNVYLQPQSQEKPDSLVVLKNKLLEPQNEEEPEFLVILKRKFAYKP